MKRHRLREQDGLIREAIKIFAIMMVIGVAMFDTFAVFNAHRAVTGDANNAAAEALHTWVATQGSLTVPESSADSFLRARDDWMVKFWTAPSPTSPQTPDFYVTASRNVSTYALKYGTHLPWIGDSIKRLLVQTGTGSTVQ
jgi:hypothetical protein